MNDPRPDLVVVGGGVAGVTAAARAARTGARVLLLEASDRLGGCVHTWQPEPDFWLELGAHTAYNSYGALLDLSAADLMPRGKVGYRFIEDGRTRSPFSRLKFMQALTHMPGGLRQDKAGRSVAEYYAGLFGPDNWSRLLAPAFAAVLSQPAGDYPADWLFRRKPRVKSAPRKFTHRDGLQAWLAAIAARPGIELRLNCRVDAVTPTPDGVELRCAGETWSARRAVLALPPAPAGALLAPWLGRVGERLAATPSAPCDSLAVVVEAQRVRLPPLAGLIGDTDAYYSAVSRDYLPHPRWRGFTFHFKPDRLDAAARRRRVAEVLGCQESDFAHLTEKRNALPALTTASVALAAELEATLAPYPVRVVGNYLNGLSLGDTAQHAVARIDAWLPEART